MSLLNKFNKILNSEAKKRLFSNFISLSVLQGANLILPLFTLPYLLRTLGIDKYGLVMFAQSFITYFSLMADYGFNLSGIREISLHKNNVQKLTRIYNSILTARLGLALLGLFIMSVVVFSIDKFALDWNLYFLTYGMVAGTALFPTWFFQGMEMMRYITILSFISKTIFTISIFIFVKSPDDYLFVPVLNSFGHIFVGLISLIIINRQFKIPFKSQKTIFIRQQLQKGWYIFISNISTNLYTTTTTFVLGLITNTIMVGYYSIAEKLIRTIVALFAPLNQAIFPHLVQLTKKSSQEAIFYIRKILMYTIVITLGIWFVAFAFADSIFHLLFTSNVDFSILIFRILSPLIIIIPIASILFNIVLLSFKMDKYFFRIYLTGAILNLILLFVLLFVLKLSTIGAALSLLICEISITIYAGIVLKQNNIKVFKL
jgi:PST family polysaccharide transporter